MDYVIILLIMNLKQKLILAGVLSFLTIQFIIAPLISHEKAEKVVKTTIESWIIVDSATAVKKFVSPELSPPVYDLQSYKIKSRRFNQFEGKVRAQFWIVLNFGNGNVLPTGQTWLCELTIDKGHWKIYNFSLEK